ncbi:MAG: YceI family protein [Bacteroidetes bacterium]|nr:YceI family protein [Bacteroidota bacterium]
MKKLNLFIATLLVAGAAAAQGTWTIDKAHSKIRFTATHMVVAEVEGHFKDFDATVTSTGADFNGADVEFTTKVASLTTENDQRDNHLRSDDFFNAEKFPEIKFKGKLVKNGNNYELKGDFTIRDITKPVSFEVTYGGNIEAFGGQKAGFKLNGKINRFDYNLKFDKKLKAGDYIVGKEIEITCKIELNKKA